MGRPGSARVTHGHRLTPSLAVEAAATLIRIAYRFEILARGRLSRSEAVFFRKTLLGALHRRRRSLLLFPWHTDLKSLGRTESSGQTVPSTTAPPLTPPTDLEFMIEEFAAAGALEKRRLAARHPEEGLLLNSRVTVRLQILLAKLDAHSSRKLNLTKGRTPLALNRRLGHPELE